MEIDSVKITPECDLWRAVITKAIKDAGFQVSEESNKFFYSKPKFRGKRKNISRYKKWQDETYSCLHLLTDNEGEWQDQREFICDAAIICPDTLRKNCLKAMGDNYKIMISEENKELGKRNC